MLKKIFTLILIISFIYVLIGNIEIRHTTDETIEEEGIKLVDKTLAICNEISEFGETVKLNKEFVRFGETQNQMSSGLNQVINFIVFPITLGLGLINLTTNCLSILTGANWRTQFSTTSVWYNNDFTSGTSYGGGGGGARGGR